jgi:predicted nuclease with TOPRIM domain
MNMFQDIKQGWKSAGFLSHDDVDWLIQEIEKLREENEDFKMKYESVGAIFGKRNMLNKIEKLEEENQRLREEIDKLKDDKDLFSKLFVGQMLREDKK